MKKYNVHVILDNKFHSAVIECDGFFMSEGAYVFYNEGKKSPPVEQHNFAYYPIRYTVIEEQKDNIAPTGSGVFKK